MVLPRYLNYFVAHFPTSNTHYQIQWSLSDTTYGFIVSELSFALNDISHHVRAAVCSCFSFLQHEDWCHIKIAIKNPPFSELLDSLCASAQDESPVVRTAAIKLLGSNALIEALQVCV